MNTSATNHYYDENGIYTGSAPANEGSLPPSGAVRDAPPSRQGCWPVRNRADGCWELVEDHRGERGWLGGVLTTVRDLGPLPEGWSATPPVQPEDDPVRSARRAAFSEQTDPIRDEALTYWAEAQGWRLRGDQVKSEAALEKCTRLLTAYVVQKEAIRSAVPDEPVPAAAAAVPVPDAGVRAVQAEVPEREEGPEAALLFLTPSGTYHARGCRYTAGSGEWLSPEAVRRRRPSARPCGGCRPPAL